MGYSVFFNSDEERAHRFPERIRQTIENGKDFILILSEGYFNQLKRNDTDDWTRVKILTAHRFGKHFAPILMDRVEKPGIVIFTLIADSPKQPKWYRAPERER